MDCFVRLGRNFNFISGRKGAEIEVISLLTVILFSLIFQLLIFNKLAPQSEGWYTLYANMILDGQVPYRDFDLLFPPLYTYIITAVTWAFGENLIVLRTFGIFLFLLNAIVFYLIFRLAFPSWVSAISAVLTLAVFQSTNVFISYDYVNVWDLFAFSSFYFLLKTTLELRDEAEVNEFRRFFIVGFLAMCGTLVRQSSGVLLIFFIILFIAVAYGLKIIRIGKKEVGSFILGLAVSFILISAPLLATGSFGPFIEQTLFSGSKGSFSNMLYGWMDRTLSGYIRLDDVLAIIALVFCSSVIIYLASREHGDYPDNRLLMICQSIAFMAIVSAVLVFLYSSNEDSSKLTNFFSNYVNDIFLLITALMIVMFVYLAAYRKSISKVHREEIAILMMLGFTFTLNWGSGTSGGLSLNEGCFGYALIAAILLWGSTKIKFDTMRRLLKLSVIGFVILIISTSVCVKVVEPYSWWGIQSESYEKASCSSNLEYFSGMELTENEKYVYESAVNDIESNIGDGDLYVYSRAMVFYTLTGEMPVVKSPVAWFDVSLNSTIGKDLEYLQTNNPEIIVFADHGDYAITEHEKSFDIGDNHRSLYNWLLYCRDDPNSNYTTISSYVLQNISIYILKLN